VTVSEPKRADDYWTRLSERLLPLSDDPPLIPGNLEALTRYWGECRPLRPAAVLIGLVEREHGLHVLLTRRHDGLSQHAGQISFPGGSIEAGDANAVAAALRETEEEVGIAAASIEPCGCVESLATVSAYRVQPVVARLPERYRLCLDPTEVSAAFELPLALAARAEVWQPYAGGRPGLEIPMQALHFQGHTVWGVTAMILRRLLERMRGLPL
jgi:8-oxo-dGTP pyrophosphatase MutT (NUDIX family)